MPGNLPKLPTVVHHVIPFSGVKDLGYAYNQSISLIPDGDHVCLRDYDTLFLSPNTPNIIQKYVDEYPNAVLTCYTNRVSELSKKQLWRNQVSHNTDILHHIDIAESIETNMTVSPINSFISGCLMVLSKETWKKHPFAETGKCLGVDTEWSNRILARGVQILRMNAIYIFHTYRLKKGVADKTHLF